MAILAQLGVPVVRPCLLSLKCKLYGHACSAWSASCMATLAQLGVPVVWPRLLSLKCQLYGHACSAWSASCIIIYIFIYLYILYGASMPKGSDAPTSSLVTIGSVK